MTPRHALWPSRYARLLEWPLRVICMWGLLTDCHCPAGGRPEVHLPGQHRAGCSGVAARSVKQRETMVRSLQVFKLHCVCAPHRQPIPEVTNAEVQLRLCSESLGAWHHAGPGHLWQRPAKRCTEHHPPRLVKQTEEHFAPGLTGECRPVETVNPPLPFAETCQELAVNRRSVMAQAAHEDTRPDSMLKQASASISTSHGSAQLHYPGSATAGALLCNDVKDVSLG